MKLFSRFVKGEQGGGLIEYTIIIALIALAAVAAITIVGTKIKADFTTVSNKL